MRATKLWIAGAVLASSFMLVSYSQSQRQTAQRHRLMREKLAHAQKLLEGISTEDFKLIQTHAERLKVISRDAEWNPHPTHRGDLQTVNIMHSLDQLVDAAKDEDLRGATLAYMSLTLSCVNCHNNSHEKEIALSDQLKEEPAIAP